MKIEMGVAFKKIAGRARATRSQPKRKTAKRSDSVIGKTFKVMGKIGLNLAQLASFVLIGKL